ncbi:MAG: hypothetical protein AMXMBFR84_28040 [Candidatus Hydrogenedentota bacterium]
MKVYSLPIAVTALNIAVFAATFFQGGAAAAKAKFDPEVLRAQTIELVAPDGTVRAQLKVEDSGEAVFRMRDSKGTVRMKIGANEDGSGLALMNEETEPGVHMLAKRDKGSSITLTEADGKQTVLKP